MDKYELTQKLRETIGNYLESQGLELVDLIFRYEGRDLFLRVLADTPQGNITLAECARINSELGTILDAQDYLKERYILEVSSPGLDRPLVSGKDFSRCRNRMVRFFLREEVNGKLEWAGTINKVEADTVFVEIDGDILEIPLNKINKAKQEII